MTEIKCEAECIHSKDGICQKTAITVSQNIEYGFGVCDDTETPPREPLSPEQEKAALERMRKLISGGGVAENLYVNPETHEVTRERRE